ncbi:unnamed protein product [Musa banksii]
MAMDMDGQSNSLYHDPQEANRDLMVEVGSNLFRKKIGQNRSNHHKEHENTFESFRESSSDLIGLDTNYEHSMSASTTDDSCLSTDCDYTVNKLFLWKKKIMNIYIHQ